jgi:hypothetical protein
MAPSYALEPLWITSLKKAGIGRTHGSDTFDSEKHMIAEHMILEDTRLIECLKRTAQEECPDHL